MDKILSQQEMNTLLNSPEGADQTGDANAAGTTPKLTVYNFRRPDRFPKPVLHALQRIHDRFCSNGAASFSAYFRTSTEMTVLSAEQSTVSDFLKSLTESTCLNTIAMRPLQGTAILEVGPDIAFPLIDRLLGGIGGPADSSRKITDIEKNVIRGVINLITTDLTEAWRPTFDLSFNVLATETNPELLQPSSPNEVVLVFAIEVKMGETRGTLHLCLPFSALEPVLDIFEKGNPVEVREEVPVPDHRRKVLRCVLKAPVTVACELHPTMVAVSDLLNLANGDVMTLDNAISDTVQLLVEGKPSFSASLMEIEGRKSAGVIGRIT
jgi:flagellar motor switch protein FliM